MYTATWRVFALILLTALAEANNPCEGLHLEFVNDFASCSRYFSCVNEFPHPLECPEGRWFYDNPVGCHLPNTVPCEPCPAEGVIYIGVPNSCIDYNLCINGILFERQCAPGTRFDVREGRCNLQELVQCDYIRCPETGTLIVPDPTSCQHYLVCDRGVEVGRRQCSEGLLFDPVLLSCAREETVDCLHID